MADNQSAFPENIQLYLKEVYQDIKLYEEDRNTTYLFIFEKNAVIHGVTLRAMGALTKKEVDGKIEQIMKEHGKIFKDEIDEYGFRNIEMIVHGNFIDKVVIGYNNPEVGETTIFFVSYATDALLEALKQYEGKKSL